MFYSALNAVSPYLLQIFIGIIAALVLVAGVQTVRLAWTKKDLRIAQAESDTFAVKILAQNQAIQQWRDEAEIAKHQVVQAQQAAAKARANSNRKAARLQAEQVPAECKQATQWAAGKAAELAEAW